MILAQKLRIPKIQFTEHVKLKKKDGHSVGASVLLRRGTKHSQEEILRQSVDQRLKESPSRERGDFHGNDKQEMDGLWN